MMMRAHFFTTRRFLTLLLFLSLVSVVSAGIVNTVVEFWSARTLIEKIFLACLAISLLAGVTGLDGGRPPKIPRIDLAKATSPSNPRVFLDISVGGKPAGRITIELFANYFPKTAENYRCLCTGEKGTGKLGKPLHYKGSKFHRVIPGFMCQGGDFTAGNGTGGESIYGGKFEDEWDKGFISHSQLGLLSMANSGRDTNGSQFYLTVKSTTWLDAKHVVFGQIEDGMAVLKAIEETGTSLNGVTTNSVVITDCGELKAKKA